MANCVCWLNSNLKDPKSLNSNFSTRLWGGLLILVANTSTNQRRRRNPSTPLALISSWSITVCISHNYVNST